MSTTQRTGYRPGLRDLIRREWYMTRLDWGLRNLPSKQNRQIQRDLRRDVTATAGDIGMRPALDDLGKPGTLASRYTAETDPEGPRYATGAVAAGIAVAAVVFLWLAYAIGTLDTLEAMGGGTRTGTLWGAETTYVSTADEISISTANILPAFLVVVGVWAVVFLLFSRIWRAARSR